jgi:hypothetical protein
MDYEGQYLGKPLGDLSESSLYRRRKKLDEPSIKNWMKGLCVVIYVALYVGVFKKAEKN